MPQAHDQLRATGRVSEGKEREPSGAIQDSLIVKTTGIGGPERGCDGIKRLESRRKRHLLVDTTGLVLGMRVHAANLHYRDGTRELLGGELHEAPPQ